MDVKTFSWLLVKKSVNYELNPVKENIDLLKDLTNYFWMCLTKIEKEKCISALKTTLNNLDKAKFKLKELEKSKEQKLDVDMNIWSNELNRLKRVK
jgi:hypothetical protein